MNKIRSLFLFFLAFLSVTAAALDSGGSNGSSAPPATQAGGKLLVYDGFEDGGVNWGRQAARPENLQAIELATARGGGQALRVTLQRDDAWVSGGPRAELLWPRELGYWEEGQEYWVGASILFPADYADDPMQEIFWQVHGASSKGQQRGRQYSSKGARQKDRNSETRDASVPFIMQSVGDSILIKAKGINPVSIQKPKGKWMDFVVHHLFSSQGRGITQVYVNGELLVDGRDISNIRQGDKLYQKFGIYKSGWKRGGDAQSTVFQREMWFDEIRIGDANSGFAAVSPATNGTEGTKQVQE